MKNRVGSIVANLIDRVTGRDAALFYYMTAHFAADMVRLGVERIDFNKEFVGILER